MTPERAKEILEYYDYQSFGALAYGAKRPQVLPPTEKERLFIWSTSTKGTDSLNSLLRKIAKA